MKAETHKIYVIYCKISVCSFRIISDFDPRSVPPRYFGISILVPIHQNNLDLKVPFRRSDPAGALCKALIWNLAQTTVARWQNSLPDIIKSGVIETLLAKRSQKGQNFARFMKSGNEFCHQASLLWNGTKQRNWTGNSGPFLSFLNGAAFKSDPRKKVERRNVSVRPFRSGNHWEWHISLMCVL